MYSKPPKIYRPFLTNQSSRATLVQEQRYRRSEPTPAEDVSFDSEVEIQTLLLTMNYFHRIHRTQKAGLRCASPNVLLAEPVFRMLEDKESIGMDRDQTAQLEGTWMLLGDHLMKSWVLRVDSKSERQGSQEGNRVRMRL